ncbi:MAG TPA: efflux RND transporter periplasmic adaptor subunit [Hyphomicrobiaceae bacterium]|nr:efflux RND transporter periplasmic adaptor subunit [Hyphomicrobiaceae bacterium]
MSFRFVITATLAALFVGALAWFNFLFKPNMIKGFISAQVPPPATVTSEKARNEQWIEQLTSIGTLFSSHGVDVTSQVAGIVTEVHAASGSDVQQGAPLVQLDIAVEQADLASAKATLAEAEVAFQRQSNLVAKQVTSEANVDTARAKRDTAQAAVNRIEAVIAQKSIKSPVSGRLGIRKVERGQYVSPGMTLVTVQQLDPIRADFPMPEQAIGKLRVGQQIEIGVDAYPNKVFKGTIESLDARVAQDTRTLLVRGSLPNPERKLLPGMFANVTVLVGNPRQVVTVPRTAVSYSLYGDSLYLVKAATPPAGDDGAKAGEAKAAAASATGERKLVAERRFIKVGQSRDDRVAIIDGVAAGEEVVTTGQLKLNPGAAIRIDNAQPLVRPEERPKE